VAGAACLARSSAKRSPFMKKKGKKEDKKAPKKGK
jgi:hypothetical protein